VKRFFVYLKTRPVGMASLIVLILMYIMMIFAEFIAPYNPRTAFPYSYHPPNVRFVNSRLQAQEHRVIDTVAWQYGAVGNSFTPIQFLGKGERTYLWGFIPMERRLFVSSDPQMPVFLMGADILGRCIFSRIVHGSRISMIIGFVAIAISTLIAMLLGGIAGFFGGKLDSIIIRSAEFIILIPGLYLILFIRSMLGVDMSPGQLFMSITLILAFTAWPTGARLYRGMIHSIKREDFVQNAKLEMIPSFVIIFKYCIPHIASIIIVVTVLGIPSMVMTEVILSYLGLGIQDPSVSWGSLINRDITTISNLRNFPWLLSPMWFLIAFAFSFNFLGDALRDYLDPFHTRKTLDFNKFLPKRFRKKVKEVVACEHDASVDAPITGSGAEPLLEVKNLKVKFRLLRGAETLVNQAVRGVSFSLNRGEILGIVGESGSGKSVSTHAIPALLPLNATITGSIKYEGNELVGLTAKEMRKYRGKKIGMIFQEPGRSYDPLYTMSKTFWETYRNSEPKITRAQSDERAARLLEEVGIDNAKERLINYPHQFSGGQLQRVGIALSLAQGCDLLIADEPTTALDVTVQKQIIDLLKDLRKTRGLSIIFISHDIDLVSDISDRMIVMYCGLMMEGASSEQFMTSAIHPYAKDLLAASPKFGNHYTNTPLAVIPGQVADPAYPEPGCPYAPRCSVASEECRATIPVMTAAENGRFYRCIKGAAE